MQQHLNRDCILHNWCQLSSKYCNFIFFLSFHPTNERSALPEDICPRILLTFCYRQHIQFHCWVFTATENKNLELRQEDSLDHQFLTVVKKILTLVNEKYIMFSHHRHPIQILKKSRTLTVTWNISTTIFCQILQCRPNIFSIYLCAVYKYNKSDGGCVVWESSKAGNICLSWLTDIHTVSSQM